MIVNNVQLIGHLGMRPELRSFENGTTMARLSLATNETVVAQDGSQIKKSEWHTCVAWGSTATNASKMLFRGAQVAISGRLVHRTYTDKTGQKRTASEVHIHKFLLTRP